MPYYYIVDNDNGRFEAHLVDIVVLIDDSHVYRYMAELMKLRRRHKNGYYFVRYKDLHKWRFVNE